MKSKLLKLLIVPILLAIGYAMLLSYPYFFSKINRYDSLGALSLVEEKSVNIQKTNNLLKGEKVSAKLKATENNLGIILFRFVKLAAKVSDTVMFRIKKEGEEKWYYENKYRAEDFQNNEYFAFGFPPIVNSKNNIYVFEIESLAGTYRNRVGVSPDSPQVALVYKDSLKDLKNYKTLSSFISKKFVYIIRNSDFLQNWQILIAFVLSLFLVLYAWEKNITKLSILRFLPATKKIKARYLSFEKKISYFLRKLVLWLTSTKFYLQVLNTNTKKRLDLFVFIFFVVLIFITFRQLFQSYFEADEWVAFTTNLPLTKDPLGFLKILIAGDTEANLFQLQHIVPINIEVFFLNTLFFGTNFAPYAFLSLLFHSLNTFLVFILIKQLLPRKFFFALLGGIFFALLPVQMHAVTWAATYSVSVLPTTLALLSIIFLELAFVKENKKFIYFSTIFLFLALFTKEATAYLFFLLPFMVIIKNRVFPLKFLSKIFIVSIVVYSVIRFVIPGIYNSNLINILLGSHSQFSTNETQSKLKDTGTIVSRDLSIYKNLPAEVLLRTVTFPVRMTGTLFLPRSTAFSIVQFITPVIIPTVAIGESSAALGFIYGSGNFVIIYLVSLAIIIFCLSSIVNFIRQKRIEDARALAIGLAIILFGALPLVAIIFTFPRWGYDFYFDSRYYYGPSVGAAIVFPFLLLGIAKFISKSLRIKSILIVTIILFLIWLVNNMYVFGGNIQQFTQNYALDRKEVVRQLKVLLPSLPQKSVFYFETDGQSAFGPVLPFYTSIPQALTVVYYDRSPLPDSFFNKPLFAGQGQGYQYSENRGFGYYMSKKNLSDDLVSGKFKSSDIYAFYYYAQKIKLKNVTLQIRKEMEDYLKKTDIAEWKLFEDRLSKIRFLYPLSTEIVELKSPDANITKSLIIKNPQFSAEIFVRTVSPSFNIQDSIQFLTEKDGTPLSVKTTEKEVFFDKYHSNKATMTNEDQPRYFIRIEDVLIYMKVENNNPEAVRTMERILGSLEIINEK